MTDTAPSPLSIRVSRREQVFPILTEHQIAALLPLGERRRYAAGATLFSEGDRHVGMFVLLSGSLDVSRRRSGSQELVITYVAGMFTGDVSLLIPEAAEGCTIEAVAFHPDGREVACGGIDWLATSGSDGAVSLWDIAERRKLGSLAGGVNALAFDPSGRTLAAGGPGEAVRIYDAATRQLLRE